MNENESSKQQTMRMNYFSSDRLDDLAAITAKILTADPQPGIIEPEIFLVQNPGMEDYLRQYLAEKLGVACNMKFALPWKYMYELTNQGRRIDSLYEYTRPDNMAWSLYSLLRTLCAKDSPFSECMRPAADYVQKKDQSDPENPFDEARLFGLAKSAAELFNAYSVYRPGWLRTLREAAMTPSDQSLLYFGNDAFNDALGGASDSGSARKDGGDPLSTENVPLSLLSLLWLGTGYGRDAAKLDPEQWKAKVSAGSLSESGRRFLRRFSWEPLLLLRYLETLKSLEESMPEESSEEADGLSSLRKEIRNSVFLSERIEAFMRSLGSGEERKALALPYRVTVFGINSLPPMFIDLLDALGHCVQVNLMVLNPCREYWGDLNAEETAEGEAARKLVDLDNLAECITIDLKNAASLSDESLAGLVRGEALKDKSFGRGKILSERSADAAREGRDVSSMNPLLSSMGRVERDFLSLIFDHEIRDTTLRADLQEFPDDFTFLDALKYDINTLTEPLLTVTDSDPKDVPLRPTQLSRYKKNGTGAPPESFRISVCSSKEREIEVLYDEILDLFNRDPELRPKDIVVMVSDIGEYAEIISSVFGSVPDEQWKRRIPFSICDRNAVQSSPFLRTFLEILELPERSFSLPAVSGILSSEPVRNRYGLSEDDCRVITAWAKEAGIRTDTGLDSSRSFSRLNSFSYGLERMMLGAVMPSEDPYEEAGGEVLPYSSIEGNGIRAAAAFRKFVRTLADAVKELSTPRTASGWQAFINGMVRELFSTRDFEEDFMLLTEAIGDMAKYSGAAIDAAGKAPGDPLIPLQVLRTFLTDRLGREPSGSTFITGKVCFCTMIPMRSIPFRHIFLVGFGQDVYPRRSETSGFDLMARHRMRGDRDRRDEDRYMFLEAIFSARKSLTISYVGRDMHSNQELEPSVLVSELLDYCGRTFMSERMEKDLSALRESVRENSRKIAESAQSGAGTDRELLRARDRGIADVVEAVGQNMANVRDELSVIEPRFSYQKENFTESGSGIIRSYRGEWCPSPATQHAQPQAEEDGSADVVDVDIGDLLSFVRKPVEFFYKKHGIIFDIYEKQLPDSEKFSIDDDYIERQELTGELVNAGLRDFMAGMGADDPMSETQKALRLFALRGQSAEGSFGRSETEELLKGVQKSGIFEAVREKAAGLHLVPAASISQSFTYGRTRYRISGEMPEHWSDADDHNDAFFMINPVSKPARLKRHLFTIALIDRVLLRQKPESVQAFAGIKDSGAVQLYRLESYEDAPSLSRNLLGGLLELFVRGQTRPAFFIEQSFRPEKKISESDIFEGKAPSGFSGSTPFSGDILIGSKKKFISTGNSPFSSMADLLSCVLSSQGSASNGKGTQEQLLEKFREAGKKAAKENEDPEAKSQEKAAELVETELKFLDAFAGAAEDDQNPVYANAFANRTFNKDEVDEIIRTSIIFHAMTEGRKASEEKPAQTQEKAPGKASEKAPSKEKKTPAKGKKSSASGKKSSAEREKASAGGAEEK